jgi:hypothetical protein
MRPERLCYISERVIALSSSMRRDTSHLPSRARALQAQGVTVARIAERLEVSLATVYGWLYGKRQRKQGTIASLQAEAVPKQPDAPVIECRTDSLGFLYFYCPHCRWPHYHQGEGWHKARCRSGPFVRTGYKLEIG